MAAAAIPSSLPPPSLLKCWPETAALPAVFDWANGHGVQELEGVRADTQSDGQNLTEIVACNCLTKEVFLGILARSTSRRPAAASGIVPKYSLR